MTAPLLLVDGSSYFFRAFHALPPLTNSKGQPTGAIYGVANMIKRLIKDYQPEHIAVIFDSSGKTFRDEWYPEYKAHRKVMPTELSSQFKPLVEVLEAMGLPVLIVEGVEADDVIGTLTSLAIQENLPVLISTSDKDMTQLVNEQVTLINTMTNQHLDRHGVKEKFGVWPTQIIDYLTLVGDSSDNIPGVPKCGPKTAVKWLDEYQTLDNLLLDVHAITGKVGEYLRASVEHLPLSKRLVTIKRDVSLSVEIPNLKIKAPNRALLIDLIQGLEFKSWLKELLNQEDTRSPIPPLAEARSFSVITDQEQLREVVQQIERAPWFCISLQTTRLDPMDATLIGISLALEDNTLFYIPLINNTLTCEHALAAIKPILESENIRKIGHNLKSTYIIFKNYNINLKGLCSDVMLESYVLDSGATRHDIESLALKYLGYKMINYVDIAGKGSKQLRFDEIALEDAAAFATEETDVILRLHQKLSSMLSSSLQHLLHDIEMPLISVLGDMEHRGVLIDAEKLMHHGQRLKNRINQLEETAIQMAGRPFNLNSPKQLQEILFQEQNLPVLAKTPTGQPSTAESILQELAHDYPLPAVIIEHRSLSKLVSTYIDALPKRIAPRTKRVHTCYNQAIAATGRLSSSDPNLQNIPIRTEEGRLIRTAFIAAPEHVLVTADYSQIELRIMAHLSKDERLVDAFNQNLDIHQATASEIFQVPLEEVNFEQRRRAKAVNFGLIYGMSAFGLSKQLKVERQEAQYYIDRYFKRYPSVLNYMEEMRKLAHQQGYVETLFGRRLYIPDINAQNLMRQKAAERAAINAPMQGTAADIIKKAMLAIKHWQLTEPQVHMIMQVHDELVFEVHHTVIESTSSFIKELMEHTVELSVPLLVSMGVGNNWDEAH